MIDTLTAQEAIDLIAWKIGHLLEDKEYSDVVKINFLAEKFVNDVLDYCNREDFPRALINTIVEIATQRIQAQAESQTAYPLKSLTENDVKFEFAVNSVDVFGCLSDLDFDSLKPKLNIYRRVKYQ